MGIKNIKERQLIEKSKRLGIQGSKLSVIKKAVKYAKLAHAGQKRESGEPYVYHGFETAINLLSWKLDYQTIAAGILHDVLEDGAATKEDLISIFGEDIYNLVEGVTKVSRIKLRGSVDDIFVENLRKMFLAMAKDIRVVLVKIADRLHNMRTLQPLSRERQLLIARETLEIYAPLADRLGMGNVKAELDDLAFSYLYPKEFEYLTKESIFYMQGADTYIRKMRDVLYGDFKKVGMKVRIDGRKKHLYSLWMKLQRPDIDWDINKIQDIIALRVVVRKITDCYSALGVVHRRYKPVPYLGVSDFIAQPKPNGYRSIHTKVFGPGEKMVEVQIRTLKMHKEAEFGIAAHWAYSEAKKRGVKNETLDRLGVRVNSSKLAWVKQLVEWQNQISDSKEFLKVVKFDTLSNRIFVFSPKGDVFDLPFNATPVDFAYAVHTDLGNYIYSAMVNGKIVQLKYKLGNGDVVEIIKSKNSKRPSPDWLEYVKTETAIRNIKKSLKM